MNVNQYLKFLLAAALTAVILPTLQAGEKAFVWHAEDPELEWGGCPEGFPDGCAIAVLQGDPAGHNADVFLRLAPDSQVPLHWHTSAERMILVSGEFHVDYQGQDPVVMHAGTYAYGPAKLPHTAYCAEGETCLLFIAFEKPVDAILGRPDD